MLNHITQDLHYSFRMMMKKPLFTIAIVLTLGTCIGAVTAVFSAVDAAIVKALPYPEPDRLAQLVRYTEYQGQTGLQQNQDGKTWEAFKASATTFDIAAYSGSSGVNFSSGNQIRYLHQQRVSAGFFKVLRIQPLLGREFSNEEDRPGGRAVAVLSHDLWKSSFHSDPTVIGQTAFIAGEKYTVVGIAAPTFRSDVEADLWTPLRPSPTGEGSGTNYTVIARLRPGSTWPQAQAEARTIGQSLIQTQNVQAGVSRYFGLMELQKSLTDGLRTPLLMILGVTVLVLLIGCSNVAGLLLSRGSARSSEIATRMALGAGRAAVVRQLLIENLMLGVVSAIAGMAIGYAGVQALRAQDIGWDILKTAIMDVRVLAAMAVFSIFATILFGVLPAFQAGRVDIRSAHTGRGVLGGNRSIFRRILPAVQVGIAVFLLIGAALLVRSFAHLWKLDAGFDASNVITATFSLRDARYEQPESTNRLFNETIRGLHNISGVESAAVALTLPYERGLNMVLRKLPDPQGTSARLANVIYVSPEFFPALRIPLLRGRLFTEADNSEAPHVMLVNDAFVRQHYATEDPIGAAMRMNDETRQIVGIVGNVQQQAGWGQFGPMAPVPSVYIPASQLTSGYLTVHVWFSPKWVIRFHGSSGNLQQQVDEAVRSVDPMLPIASFQTLQDVKAQAFAWNQFLATALGLGAALALLLSITGMYAMISNSVVERTREFGIRMALGATIGQTIRTAVKPAVICSIVGLAGGVIAARLETKLVEGLVYGVTPTDLSTFLLVPVAVLIIATVASIIPALRITGVDPALTLRQE
jgi:putative ABC transport system permease protein